MNRAGPLMHLMRALVLALALVAPAALAQEGGHGGDAEAPDLGHGPAAAVTDDPEAQDHGQAGEHGAAGEEHSAGLPQLDVRTFPSQIVWLILAFGTLYWLMIRKALPRLTDILEAREERIASDLDRAATLRGEAESALERYEQVVADAHNKAAERLKEVQDRLAAEAAQRQAKLEADLEAKLDDAEGRIRTARDAALGEVQNVAAEVARSAVQRLSGLEASEREVQDALARVQAEAA